MVQEIQHLKGLDVIVEERLRQVGPLGYDVQHDDAEHTVEELLRVGACYIDWAANEAEGYDPTEMCVADKESGTHMFWPDTSIPWKPEPTIPETAAKGAAFVAAALDLLYAKLNGEV